jgi:uncharacterized protein with HEPN domain
LRRDDERLKDILEAAEAVGRYLAGTTLVGLLSDEMVQDAVLRRFTVIGEAANNLSDSFRQSYPTVSWSGTASFRHFVVHGYFRIDWEIVWETATVHLPSLAFQVRQILADLGPDKP